jgi:pimeloyl-ACP methyl ester carboxylesterase
MDKHAERLVGDIKGAELRIVPHQGHMLHYAVPERVVAAIGDVTSRAGSAESSGDLFSLTH